MNTTNLFLRHWLVVDDDAMLAGLLAGALRGLGLAEVEQFSSAIEVLMRPGAPLGAFDLVMTDRDMPGLDGLEFSRRLHAISPATKIVLVSAHTEDLADTDLRRAGINAVLPKPFSLQSLESVVRSIAGGPTLANVAGFAVPERRAA